MSTIASSNVSPRTSKLWRHPSKRCNLLGLNINPPSKRYELRGFSPLNRKDLTHSNFTRHQSIQTLLQMEDSEEPCPFRDELLDLIPDTTEDNHTTKLAVQILSFEQSSRYRLDTLLQRATHTWNAVERHNRELEQLKQRNRTADAKSLEQYSLTELQIQQTIDVLSQRLQEYAMCDQELQEFDLCVREGFVDVLKLYREFLESDIAISSEYLQKQALAAFQMEQTFAAKEKEANDKKPNSDMSITVSLSSTSSEPVAPNSDQDSSIISMSDDSSKEEFVDEPLHKRVVPRTPVTVKEYLVTQEGLVELDESGHTENMDNSGHTENSENDYDALETASSYSV